jgi:hypothetical protein
MITLFSFPSKPITSLNKNELQQTCHYYNIPFNTNSKKIDLIKLLTYVTINHRIQITELPNYYINNIYTLHYKSFIKKLENKYQEIYLVSNKRGRNMYHIIYNKITNSWSTNYYPNITLCNQDYLFALRNIIHSIEFKDFYLTKIIYLQLYIIKDIIKYLSLNYFSNLSIIYISFYNLY